jgi:hypothetical protein
MSPLPTNIDWFWYNLSTYLWYFFAFYIILVFSLIIGLRLVGLQRKQPKCLEEDVDVAKLAAIGYFDGISTQIGGGSVFIAFTGVTEDGYTYKVYVNPLKVLCFKQLIKNDQHRTRIELESGQYVTVLHAIDHVERELTQALIESAYPTSYLETPPHG